MVFLTDEVVRKFDSDTLISVCFIEYDGRISTVFTCCDSCFRYSCVFSVKAPVISVWLVVLNDICALVFS